MVALFGAFGKNGALNPYLASWLPNIVTGVAGSALIWREDR
jgi:lipopolysaccharide export LptBFGC system permease protein LptF